MSDSRYTIIERPDGFRIEGKDRTPVEVTVHQTHFRVEILGNDEDRCYLILGLYLFYHLCEVVALGLMLYWEPPDRGDPPKWQGLESWAKQKTARAICRRVHAQWERLLAEVDPTVLEVQRAIFAATFRSPWISLFPELYEHRYIVSDIIRYRAAAIAARNVHRFDHATYEVVFGEKAPALARRGNWARACKHGFHRYATDYQLFSSALGPATEALSEWRTLFSSTGETYRSLDRTLMNLPGGIPDSLLFNLRYDTLVRPVFQRLELIAILLSWGLQSTTNRRVFDYATTEQIKEAMRRVAEHTHNDLSPRRAKDVRYLVHFLMDYPEEHPGNIVGLADKSIRWHREGWELKIAAQLEKLGADKKTAEPPIPLPTVPGIRFLDTVGAVCEEGMEMGHCVASYARQAVRGQCFLFHIDLDDEQATVEVRSDGSVVQAQGPRNLRNGAAKWGARQLKRWGREFPEEYLPQTMNDRFAMPADRENWIV